MSKSSGFQKYSICCVFRHFVCVFVFVVVFVIVFVFVFVSSYDFWIAFIIRFQNMYGYRGLWSLRAEIMIIFKVMTDGHSPIPLIDSAHSVGWAEWKGSICWSEVTLWGMLSESQELQAGQQQLFVGCFLFLSKTLNNQHWVHCPLTIFLV